MAEDQTSLLPTGKGRGHTGLCGSRRGDWGPAQMCLKPSCRSLEQMVQTGASDGSSEFRCKEQTGEENICNPAAGHGALHRCDGLNVLGLLFRWHFTDVLHLWPAQHHLHVEHDQIRARQWLHTFLQDESGVHYLSLKPFLNGTINACTH